MANSKNEDYVYGNTVTMPEYVPVKKEDSEKYKKLDKAKREAQLKIQRIRTKERLSVIKLITFLFICGVAMISSCAYVYKMEASLSGYKTVISELRSENDSLNFKLYKSSNLKTLQDDAINKLHMQVPVANDAIKVDLDKNNFKSEKAEVSSDNIIDKIKKILF